MNGDSSASWTGAATKAAWTVLLVAGAAFVAWEVLKHFVVAIVLILALLGIYRWLFKGRM